jgi:hypothetical protein
MSMAWNELPPDFLIEPFENLFRRLSALDVLAICQYRGNDNSQVLVLLDHSVETGVLSYLKPRAFESGGLILGRTFSNFGAFDLPIKYIVLISGFVTADDAHGTATALRMEPQLWSKANRERQKSEFVVGWFHSHPNLGAFFSGTDRRTQSSFFTAPHKLGWVIDPVRAEEAWFSGQQSLEVPPQIVVRGNYGYLVSTE